MHLKQSTDVSQQKWCSSAATTEAQYRTRITTAALPAAPRGQRRVLSSALVKKTLPLCPSVQPFGYPVPNTHSFTQVEQIHTVPFVHLAPQPYLSALMVRPYHGL